MLDFNGLAEDLDRFLREHNNLVKRYERVSIAEESDCDENDRLTLDTQLEDVSRSCESLVVVRNAKYLPSETNEHSKRKLVSWSPEKQN